jgi:hypothetical protein
MPEDKHQNKTPNTVHIHFKRNKKGCTWDISYASKSADATVKKIIEVDEKIRDALDLII